MREVTLPSGAILTVTSAPFADAKALYQSLLAEAKDFAITAKTDLASVFKDLICVGFSSKNIEDKLWKCLDRCLYNKLRIDDQTFEPVDRRQDYVAVCLEVAKENITPFVKHLYAEYQRALAGMEKSQA